MLEKADLPDDEDSRWRRNFLYCISNSLIIFFKFSHITTIRKGKKECSRTREVEIADVNCMYYCLVKFKLGGGGLSAGRGIYLVSPMLDSVMKIT